MAIKLNYEYTIEIDTDPGGTETLVPVCEGFENISFGLNNVLFESAYLCGNGWGLTEVTGGKYIVTLTGKRIYGDAAQDYIFGTSTLFDFGEARKTTLNVSDGIETISGTVTIANADVTGGDAQNPSDVTVEFHYYGEPTITTNP